LISCLFEVSVIQSDILILYQTGLINKSNHLYDTFTYFPPEKGEGYNAVFR